ncbi:MAG: hypothetical protein NXH75_06130 [Halobacteriovoraceae bacterium]|nr:hypothetical protein [Halobacteriovoraceae bacterium]
MNRSVMYIPILVSLFAFDLVLASNARVNPPTLPEIKQIFVPEYGSFVVVPFTYEKLTSLEKSSSDDEEEKSYKDILKILKDTEYQKHLYYYYPLSGKIEKLKWNEMLTCETNFCKGRFENKYLNGNDLILSLKNETKIKNFKLKMKKYDTNKWRKKVKKAKVLAYLKLIKGNIDKHYNKFFLHSFFWNEFEIVSFRALDTGPNDGTVHRRDLLIINKETKEVEYQESFSEDTSNQGYSGFHTAKIQFLMTNDKSFQMLRLFNHDRLNCDKFFSVRKGKLFSIRTSCEFIDLGF